MLVNYCIDCDECRNIRAYPGPGLWAPCRKSQVSSASDSSDCLSLHSKFASIASAHAVPLLVADLSDAESDDSFTRAEDKITSMTCDSGKSAEDALRSIDELAQRRAQEKRAGIEQNPGQNAMETLHLVENLQKCHENGPHSPKKAEHSYCLSHNTSQALDKINELVIKRVLNKEPSATYGSCAILKCMAELELSHKDKQEADISAVEAKPSLKETAIIQTVNQDFLGKEQSKEESRPERRAAFLNVLRTQRTRKEGATQQPKVPVVREKAEPASPPAVSCVLVQAERMIYELDAVDTQCGREKSVCAKIQSGHAGGQGLTQWEHDFISGCSTYAEVEALANHFDKCIPDTRCDIQHQPAGAAPSPDLYQQANQKPFAEKDVAELPILSEKIVKVQSDGTPDEIIFHPDISAIEQGDGHKRPVRDSTDSPENISLWDAVHEAELAERELKIAKLKAKLARIKADVAKERAELYAFKLRPSRSPSPSKSCTKTSEPISPDDDLSLPIELPSPCSVATPATSSASSSPSRHRTGKYSPSRKVVRPLLPSTVYESHETASDHPISGSHTNKGGVCGKRVSSPGAAQTATPKSAEVWWVHETGEDSEKPQKKEGIKQKQPGRSQKRGRRNHHRHGNSIVRSNDSGSGSSSNSATAASVDTSGSKYSVPIPPLPSSTDVAKPAPFVGHESSSLFTPMTQFFFQSGMLGAASSSRSPSPSTRGRTRPAGASEKASRLGWAKKV